MSARIFCPPKSAMQSGRGKSKDWTLEFEQETAREIEPLMGWTSSADTRTQVRLRFETREEAVAYAERNALVYRVEEPQTAARRGMAYSDNFKSGRVGQWTH